jgi:hypothetical protein
MSTFNQVVGLVSSLSVEDLRVLHSLVGRMLDNPPSSKEEKKERVETAQVEGWYPVKDKKGRFETWAPKVCETRRKSTDGWLWTNVSAWSGEKKTDIIKFANDEQRHWYMTDDRKIFGMAWPGSQCGKPRPKEGESPRVPVQGQSEQGKSVSKAKPKGSEQEVED